MAILERLRRRGGKRGSVLPLILVGLAAVALLALAGWQSSTFGLRASRNQVAATAALHAADSGLALYLGGVGPVGGPLSVGAPPGRAVVTALELVRLADSSRVVRLTARGSAPVGDPRPVVRRLELLVRVDAEGARRAVPGSWRERI